MKEREKEYIITFVFRQGFASGGQEKVASYLEDIFKKYKGAIESLRFFGDRRFAYPIKGEQMGFYVFAECKMVNSQMRFFRRDLELSSDIVLRFLILSKEDGQKVLNISDLAEYKYQNGEEKDVVSSQ